MTKSRMRWEGHVACMGERRSVNRVLVGKPEGKNHLEDPSVDGMDLQEVGCGGYGLDQAGSG
jgi:hypothetical protein